MHANNADGVIGFNWHRIWGGGLIAIKSIALSLAIAVPIAAQAGEVIAETPVYLQRQPQRIAFVDQKNGCRYVGHTEYNKTNFHFTMPIDYQICRGRQLPFKGYITVLDGQLLRPEAPAVAVGDVMVLVPQPGS